MKGKYNNDMGRINIATDVIATIAGSSAMECAGVIGMASANLSDGFAKLLKKESMQKGIQVSVTDDGSLKLRMHIIVAYGVNIYTVSNNLIDNVKYQVEAHTGLSVSGIDVLVEGVRRID